MERDPEHTTQMRWPRGATPRVPYAGIMDSDQPGLYRLHVPKIDPALTTADYSPAIIVPGNAVRLMR